MPARPQWLLAIPDAIRQLEALDRELLTRRDIEQLFGVSRARAAQLMHTFGADLTGYARTLPRTKLLRQLRTYRAGTAFRGEQDRREHLMTELRKARLTGIRVAVPVEALEGRLSDLPAGVVHVVTKGATPVLTPAETRSLLDGIDPGSLVGLRDRALLSVMVYSFARVSAVVGMRRRDYFLQGTRGWLRLHEKGGKRHDVPAHHRAEAAVDAYLVAGGVEDAKAPLFQSVDRSRRLSGRSLTRRVVLAMIKRRAVAAGLPASTCCHTFRATGITAYLSNGGTLEHAQQIAGHASPRTTKLYDRTADTVTLDEIERIVI